MLGSFGNVIGALDDLLSEELVVHRGGPGLRRRSLTALHLQPRGTGGQQAEGAVDCVQSRALWREEGDQSSRRMQGCTRRERRPRRRWRRRQKKNRGVNLTLGKSEAISVTAEWIFSEQGTKLWRTELNYLPWQQTQPGTACGKMSFLVLSHQICSLQLNQILVCLSCLV